MKAHPNYGVFLAALLKFMPAASMNFKGIGKFTRATANPDVAGAFARKYLACAGQGPEPIVRHTACAWYDKCIINGAAHQFNIATHYVNATKRPAGAVPVAAFEAGLKARFEGAMKGGGFLDDFMEFSLGLYSHDLDAHATALADGGVPFFPLSWPDGAARGFSLLVPVPGAESVIFEILGPSLSTAAAARGGGGGGPLSVPGPRLAGMATTFSNATCPGCDLIGAKVSYPSADANGSAHLWAATLGGGDAVSGGGSTVTLHESAEEVRAVLRLPGQLDKFLNQVHARATRSRRPLVPGGQPHSCMKGYQRAGGRLIRSRGLGSRHATRARG